MSQHFIDYNQAPPGVSSFTKLRLGWISRHQAQLVMPGETRYVSLSPLSKNGESLVIKVPLSRGYYYLIENRQPIGFDRVLPDSGILILSVNTKVQEGSGTVQVMDANPNSPYYSQATFRLDQKNRTIFMDEENNIAVIPLWLEKGNQDVLITSNEKSADALKAALMIEKLRKQFADHKGEKEKRILEECTVTFKRFEFKKCYQIAKQKFRKEPK